jgi:hypothetical protein
VSNLGIVDDNIYFFIEESFLNYLITSRKSSLSKVSKYTSVIAIHEADLVAYFAVSARRAY